MVTARTAPLWRTMPSNTRSSVASAPVWLAAASAPRGVIPPLTSTTGFASAAFRTAAANRRPSSTPST